MREKGYSIRFAPDEIHLIPKGNGRRAEEGRGSFRVRPGGGMYSGTIVFPIRKGAMEEASEAIWILSAAWWRSGQVIGDPIVSVRGSSISFRSIVPERTSLSGASGTDRTRKAWRGFRPLLRGRPRMAFERLQFAPPACRCGKPRRSYFSPTPEGPASPLW
jgi:hypothetical protein